MVRIKKLSVGALVSCLFLSCSPSAFAEGDWLMSAIVKNRTALVLLALIVIGMLVLTVCLTVCGKRNRANFLWTFIAMLFTSAALITAVIGSSVGTVYTKIEGDPIDTVTEFFDSVKSGNYVITYACLKDYNGLGLERQPSDENGVQVYNAMKAAFDYSVTAPAQISKLHALVPVSVKYLKIQDAQQGIEEKINKNLEKIVAESRHDQVYDANEKYLPQVTERAYSDALATVLNNAEQFCVTEQLNIELEYTDGQWFIISNPQLLNTLVGGTAQ